jgi:glycosyltransferase involved in cell wall biosynthesis
MKHSKHTFQVVSMSARYWQWRMQGGAVTMATKALEALREGFKPDLIFATDMVNVPAFLALTRGAFNETPILLYFHQNRLTHPLAPDETRDHSFSYINYLSALTADRVVFNSHFHFQEFTDALPILLGSFPDYTHLEKTREIRQKSVVLHRGMSLKQFDEFANAHEPLSWGIGAKSPIILWNHRWDEDKNPHAFFRLLNRLDDVGCKFRLILAGEHFTMQPQSFDQSFQRFADRILHYGYAEDVEEYGKLLHRADLVISTAVHEFFGVTLMEAIYCGCHPLLPNKLSYPELIPESLHEPLLHAPVLYENEDQLFDIMHRILKGEERLLPSETLKQIPASLDWSVHVHAFDALVEETTHTHIS